MVVKMMKWSPWPPATTRKFQVKVKYIKFESFHEIKEECICDIERVMAIEMRWKGSPKPGLVSFHRTSKLRKHISSEKIVKKGEIIEWNDVGFENVCSFSILPKENGFAPWDVSFRLLYGEKAETKAKLAVIGKVSLNLGELLSNYMETGIERKLPMTLRDAGVSSEATFSVYVGFVEIRDFQDSEGISQNSAESNNTEDLARQASVAYRQGELKHERRNEESPGDADESIEFDSVGMQTESEPSPSSVTRSESVSKVGLFSWKRQRLNFKPAKTKGESLIQKTNDEDRETRMDVDRPQSGCSSVDSDSSSCSGPKEDTTETSSEPKYQSDINRTDHWEVKDLVSRDGQAKLKASVFFASFDQRSDRAAGASACTALVALIAHWLHSNQSIMPMSSEFENLIVQGSSEWRKLGDDNGLINRFPDKHFDLDTVLGAQLCPVTVSSEKSFIGFFSPEKFKSLNEAMSFGDIWNEIDGNVEDNTPRIYIVSWNDHFFVLKLDLDAYYIIDTLGERLYEGCNQAYILRFDDSAMMSEKIKREKVSSEETAAEEEEREDEICRGKECCREFMKRFLAAIPLRELEEEEKKETVSYVSLHQRLQIEFNFSSCSLSSSSSTSPSLSSSPSSLVSNDSLFDQGSYASFL